MKIIEVARKQKDLLNEGMAFIAVWSVKQGNGKFSWYTEDFHPEEVNDCDPTFNEEQLARLAEIAELDGNAVLLNGYYDSWVGSADEPLNAAQIADGIRRHYEMDSGRLKDFLAGEQEDDNEPAADLCDIECEPELDFSYEEKMAAEISEQIVDAPEYEDLQLTEREEFGLGQERRDPIGEDGMQASDVPDFEEDEYCDQHHPGNYASESLPEDLAAMADEIIGKPTTLTIELPWKSCGDLTAAKDTLCKLIESKATLIKAALGEDGTGNLPIEFTAENTVKFEWLKLGTQEPNPANGEAITFGWVGDWDSVRTAWTEFLCAAVKFSKKAQRITAKDNGELGANPKFEFRCTLVKIGLKGAEYKVCRKTLLRNLDGDSAFATPESKAKWQAKYLKGGADNEN